MKNREILVIGAGIAGCAVALALAKRGITVSIMTSHLDPKASSFSFIKQESLEEKIRELQSKPQDQLCCSRAHEQLSTLAKKSVDELLESNFIKDRHGNIDLHRSLHEQLKQHARVEWISQHSLIELLMLDQHSTKPSDRYKKPTCIGVIAFNHEAKKIEYILAKEIILATGGASSLYPFSSRPQSAVGEGLAIAFRAGARLLNMEQVHFHPLALYEKDRPCFPLPLELLYGGGKMYHAKNSPLQIDFFSQYFIHQLYEQLLKDRHEHLWLDVTMLDPVEVKEKFPSVDMYCLQYGFNIAKDPLPVVPIAGSTCGGIAVDRVGQTSIQRLRAIGDVSCTGLFWNYKEGLSSVLESLVWALACAEDIEKQIKKFAYYFPELREGPKYIGNCCTLIEEDWKLLRQIMWCYLGIKRDLAHLKRGCALLEQLSLLNTPENLYACSIDQIQYFYAIQVALLIGNFARAQQSNGSSLTANASSFFLKVPHENQNAALVLR